MGSLPAPVLNLGKPTKAISQIYSHYDFQLAWASVNQVVVLKL